MERAGLLSYHPSDASPQPGELKAAGSALKWIKNSDEDEVLPAGWQWVTGVINTLHHQS